MLNNSKMTFSSRQSERPRRDRRSGDRESGVVLLELALILPIFFLLVFASIEYSRILRAHQTFAAVAREAAREAYRECGSQAKVSCGADVAMQTCLEGVGARLVLLQESARKLGAPFVSGTKLILSGYVDEAVTCGTPPCPFIAVRSGWFAGGSSGVLCDDPGAQPNGRCSHYRPDVVDNPSNNLRNVLDENGVLIIAEVYGTYNIVDIPYFPTNPTTGIGRTLSEYYYAAVQ